MMENPARARKWMLLAAPAMALSGALFGAVGAAAGLALWLGLGLLLDGGNGRIKLYPKQRRMKIYRLFLGYSFCVFCLTGFCATGKLLLDQGLSSLSDFLLLLGSIFLSLPLGTSAAKWPLRRRTATLLSVGFQGLFILFFLFV